MRFPWLGVMLLTLSGGWMLVGCGEPQVPSGPEYHTRQPATEGVYRLAVHPLHNPQKLVEVYGPLADYLVKRIPGARFEIEASTSYAHFETKLQSRGPEFILPNPYQTLKAIEHGYRVLAEAGDSADFKGIFIVRRDSPLRIPQDLHGATLAYPAPTALAAAMLPQHWLTTQGLDVADATRSLYVGSQESAILSAHIRQSAVGVTWPPPWRAFQLTHAREAAELKMLWSTPPLINNSFMARDDVPAELVDRVRSALLDLHKQPQGKTLLAHMTTARFHPADNARYQAVVGGFLKDFQARVGPLP